MQTAVIYARYSSDSQTEQSIDGQLRVCRNYAKDNNLIVVEEYIDRAKTGTNDLRPDFQRMIHDSSKQQWSYVIVYKLDRFSRNKYEATIHKHTLKVNGVKLISATENIPDTPEGIIYESLLEGVNQYYSLELSQKVKRGLNESYIKGLFTGGTQIYGYKVIDKKNVIDEQENEIVKEIFNKYANGETVVGIANDLKFRGIKRKNGKYLDTSYLYKMLFNSKYNGRVVHNDTTYTNIYPQLIDNETWQKVQEYHKANKHSPSRKKEIYDFLLSGKLICGDCKRLMVGDSGTSSTGEKYYYYSCLSKRRKNIDCKQKPVKKQELEDLVFATTKDFVFKEENIKIIAQKVFELNQKEIQNNITLKALENKLSVAVKSSNNLISALEQGFITEQTKTRLKELENQISTLQFEIEKEKHRKFSFLTTMLIEDFLKQMLNKNDDIIVRKNIINTYVKNVILYESKIAILFNFTIKPTDDKLDYEWIEKQFQSTETALTIESCSDIQDCSPPFESDNTYLGIVGFFYSK